ncbi:MAG: FecR domain-containing protein [Kiritimatiellae bacterium]|nr:FecR domain-containing protein [Kiritimatiellia bacterium]
MSAMQETDSLLQAYLDGQLPAEGAACLRAWLESAPEHLEEFIQQVDVHAGLWEELAQPAEGGVVEVKTPAAVHSAGEAEADAREQAPVSDGRIPVRWRWGVGLSVAASLAVAAGLAAWLTRRAPDSTPRPARAPAVTAQPFNRPRPSEPEMPGPVFAALISAAPGTWVHRARVPVPASAGMALEPDDEVATPGGGQAVIELAGRRGRLELEPRTRLTLSDGEAGSRLVLSEGGLSADVTRRGHALLFETPHAAVDVLGTKFVLAATPDATRLEVTDGRVRLTNRQDGKPLVVSGGPYVVYARRGTAEAQPSAAAAGIAVVGMALIDAATGEPVPGFDPLTDDAVLNYAELPTRHLNILARCEPAAVGCVAFNFDDEIAWTERSAPYALKSGDGKYGAWTPSLGPHAITATPYSGPCAGHTAGDTAGGTGEPGVALKIRFRVIDEPGDAADVAVVSLTLFNAETGRPIPEHDPLRDGAVLKLGVLPTRKLTVVATCSPATVGCVSFDLDDGRSFWTERTAPYALNGDDNDLYKPWTPTVGRHTLTVTPYAGEYLAHDRAGESGTGRALTVRFEVVE